jgi:hypothetical protein
MSVWPWSGLNTGEQIRSRVAASQTPRLLVPQVLQPSVMDSAPAVLHALLQAYGLPGVLVRLRDALQTSIQIPTLETLRRTAEHMGLKMETQLMPPEHVLMPQGKSLPAVTCIAGANNLPHFILLWSHWGGRVQVMDPHEGRVWTPVNTLQGCLEPVWEEQDASVWRAQAGNQAFIAPLRQRLHDLDLPQSTIDRLVGYSVADESWHSFAALDAAVRLAAPLVRSGDLNPGPQAADVITRLFEAGRHQGP